MSDCVIIYIYIYIYIYILLITEHKGDVSTENLFHHYSNTCFGLEDHHQFEHKNKRIYIYIFLKLRKKLIKCYIWSIALCGAETWTLRAADQKHLESFEMWCWRRMEKISLDRSCEK